MTIQELNQIVNSLKNDLFWGQSFIDFWGEKLLQSASVFWQTECDFQHTVTTSVTLRWKR